MICLRLLSVCSVVILAFGCGQSAEGPPVDSGSGAPQDGASVAPADDSDDSTPVGESTPTGASLATARPLDREPPVGGAESEHAYVTLAYADFQKTVIESDRPVLVDLWAPWCPPCLKLGPIIEQIAVDYRDRVIVAKINTDENPQIGTDFEVKGIPTLLFFKDGELVARLVGLRQRDEITAQLDALLSDG